MRWYNHDLRKEDENMIVKALKFTVRCSRERPKQTGKKRHKEWSKKNVMVKEDACDWTKWRGLAKTMTIQYRPISSTGTTPDPKWDDVADGSPLQRPFLKGVVLPVGLPTVPVHHCSDLSSKGVVLPAGSTTRSWVPQTRYKLRALVTRYVIQQVLYNAWFNLKF